MLKLRSHHALVCYRVRERGTAGSMATSKIDNLYGPSNHSSESEKTPYNDSRSEQIAEKKCYLKTLDDDLENAHSFIDDVSEITSSSVDWTTPSDEYMKNQNLSSLIGPSVIRTAYDRDDESVTSENKYSDDASTSRIRELKNAKRRMEEWASCRSVTQGSVASTSDCDFSCSSSITSVSKLNTATGPTPPPAMKSTDEIEINHKRRSSVTFEMDNDDEALKPVKDSTSLKGDSVVPPDPPSGNIEHYRSLLINQRKSKGSNRSLIQSDTEPSAIDPPSGDTEKYCYYHPPKSSSSVSSRTVGSQDSSKPDPPEDLAWKRRAKRSGQNSQSRNNTKVQPSETVKKSSSRANEPIKTKQDRKEELNCSNSTRLTSNKKKDVRKQAKVKNDDDMSLTSTKTLLKDRRNLFKSLKRFGSKRWSSQKMIER